MLEHNVSSTIGMHAVGAILRRHEPIYIGKHRKSIKKGVSFLFRHPHYELIHTFCILGVVRSGKVNWHELIA